MLCNRASGTLIYMQITGDLVKLADFDSEADPRFCLTNKHPDLTNTSRFKTTF